MSPFKRALRSLYAFATAGATLGVGFGLDLGLGCGLNVGCGLGVAGTEIGLWAAGFAGAVDSARPGELAGLGPGRVALPF